MDIFSVDFTLGELQLLRQSLDAISISGRDAKYVASLQVKLEENIQDINLQLQQFELQKQQELVKAIEADKKKHTK